MEGGAARFLESFQVEWSLADFLDLRYRSTSNEKECGCEQSRRDTWGL